MNENTPEPEPEELFTLFAFTSKHIRGCYYKLIDYTCREFRATRAQALARAKDYFASIGSKYKSVTLYAHDYRSPQYETKIFKQETL